MQPAQLLDRHDLADYRFVGAAGHGATANAEKLLHLVARRLSPDLATHFALPKFNEYGSEVSWFSHRPGVVRAFTALEDGEQGQVLTVLAQAHDRIRGLAADLAAGGGQDSRLYGALLPLMLLAPVPFEEQVWMVDGQPVIVSWGMQKGGVQPPPDQLGGFIRDWRDRLAQRRQRAEAAARAEAQERTFLNRLFRAGAASGAVDVSLIWNDVNDLDLHVECPDGSRICFESKSACGGLLDVDRNAFASALTAEPVENISWHTKPTRSGTYRVGVHFFRQHDPGKSTSAYSLRLKLGGRVSAFQGEIAVGAYQQVTDFVI
ncbi:hypothetical protein [Oleisolibacter albus]|uniref:hypothetical protein n=1 Tax=Oleisolibacter albus TaxID=2171757 RepID=UPI000DF38261|nr:hypothetical protein [Oleisolibacter albus]